MPLPGAAVLVLKETTDEQFQMFRNWIDEQGQMHNDLVQAAHKGEDLELIADLDELADMFQNMCADLEIPGWEV